MNDTPQQPHVVYYGWCYRPHSNFKAYWFSPSNPFEVHLPLDWRTTEVSPSLLPTGPDGTPRDPVLVWLNSPGNPDGHVLDAEQLARIVAWARGRGAIVISDECYAELPWAEPWVSQGVPSLLDPRVGGTRPDGAPDRSGLIVLYSLSKQSNLAGYRAAFLAGEARALGTGAHTA